MRVPSSQRVPLFFRLNSLGAVSVINTAFVREAVRETYSDKTPLSAPDVRHPSRQGWENHGVALYKQVFGEAEYARYTQTDLPIPMPEPTPALKRNLDWRVWRARMLFGFKALVTGRRATHMRGVGGRGTIRIVDHPEFPEHEFLQARRVFPCRIRHANASFYDDAAIQVRGCSLKFADSDWESPLDIITNSGAVQAFWSFDSFMAFVNARVKCREDYWDPQREFMHVLPTAYVGTIESVRSAPTSWAEVVYHSCVVFPFRARDGKSRYVKYRIILDGLTQESGLTDLAMQHEPWVQRRPANDNHPRSYLVEEYRERLKKGPVVYRLQMQCREWTTGETYEFFNPSRYWDETQHPWLDVATVEITEALEDAATERMRMWLGHQPPSLGVTDANSAVDYRSLVYARYHVYPTSQGNRKWLRSLGILRKMPADF